MEFLKKVLDALEKFFFSEDETPRVEEQMRQNEIPDELDSPEGWK